MLRHSKSQGQTGQTKQGLQLHCAECAPDAAQHVWVMDCTQDRAAYNSFNDTCTAGVCNEDWPECGGEHLGKHSCFYRWQSCAQGCRLASCTSCACFNLTGDSGPSLSSTHLKLLIVPLDVSNGHVLGQASSNALPSVRAGGQQPWNPFVTVKLSYCGQQRGGSSPD